MKGILDLYRVTDEFKMNTKLRHFC